jgi:hypothetical protein
MATQSSTTTLENCLPAMDYLLSLFEEANCGAANRLNVYLILLSA